MILAAMAMLLSVSSVSAQVDVSDKERLGMALEYFQTGKYHEALLLFERLEKQYTLNPRYHAYIGMCLFYEWDFERAAKKLSSCLPKLESLSPRERSVYCFTCAESYFFIQKYKEAISYYEQMLLLCNDNERADAFFRLGFCYIQLGNIDNALEYLLSAQACYERYPQEDKNARLTQIGNMVKGLEKQKETLKLQQESSTDTEQTD